MKLEITLDVALKGADLVASTARIALRDKMGMGEALAGLARLDRYRFTVSTSRDPLEVVAALQGVFDRRSTFYSRNKHEYVLTARWVDGEHHSGAGPAALRARFARALGSDTGARELAVVELAVRDDNDEDVEALSVKVNRDLAGGPMAGDAEVACAEASTVWWLAFRTADPASALDLARKAALTRSRDEGLLANPAYQSVDFGEAKSAASFVESAG